MKLNIEELAAQALGPEPLAYFGAYKEELHDLARLIVERCATECSSLWRIDGQFTADEFASEIRNLLEAE